MLTFFCEREDILKWSTVHPPFYNQALEERRNYTKVPKATVLPLPWFRPARLSTTVALDLDHSV